MLKSLKSFFASLYTYFFPEKEVEEKTPISENPYFSKTVRDVHKKLEASRERLTKKLISLPEVNLPKNDPVGFVSTICDGLGGKIKTFILQSGQTPNTAQVRLEDRNVTVSISLEENSELKNYVGGDEMTVTLEYLSPTVDIQLSTSYGEPWKYTYDQLENIILVIMKLAPDFPGAFQGCSITPINPELYEMDITDEY